MTEEVRVLVIGAHPDDCEFRCGGTTLKYVKKGYKVRFLSMSDGSGGHHMMKKEDIRERRLKETQKVAELFNIEYDVWDIPDCELNADLKTRKRLIRYIRRYDPDIVFCSRPNDYHADHRNSSLLVQDASYLLVVPNFCEDVPALKEVPVIMNFFDNFQNPPFKPDVMVRTDDVIDEVFKMLDCHESQVYEWLPYTRGKLEEVPEDGAERLKWLRSVRIPKNKEDLIKYVPDYSAAGAHYEYREAVPAIKYADKLVEKYGEEGKNIRYAEAFSICEYGSPLTIQKKEKLFPF